MGVNNLVCVCVCFAVLIYATHVWVLLLLFMAQGCIVVVDESHDKQLFSSFIQVSEYIPDCVCVCM